MGGERAIPEKRVRSVTGKDEQKEEKGKKTGVGMLSGWAAGTFFYVPRMVDRARNEKRNSPWEIEVFFSEGLCTSQKQGIIVEK